MTPASLEQSFAEATAGIPARVGIEIVSTGSAEGLAFGDWSTGVAWSTIKVPLAIAYLRENGAAVDSLVVEAITQSSNEAAETMFARMGDPGGAAAKVDTVLRETGDDVTMVQSQRVRAGFTPFGQTIWTLANQASFAAQLPCLDRGPDLIEQMSNVGGNQNWGLADIAAVKGGWGPSEGGGYLVRQLAVISTDSGQIGVGLAAQPNDGSFDTGVAAVNSLAAWLTTHLAELPRGTCAP